MRDLDRHLLNDFQRGFPLAPRPFAVIAERLGASEAEVIEAFGGLAQAGRVSRIGAAVATGSAGASTLAALAVPPERLEAVAEMVSGYDEVNHNYEREHRYNLWFVVTAADQSVLQRVLEGIEANSGLEVLDLPMEAAYHIDLGFDLEWEDEA